MELPAEIIDFLLNIKEDISAKQAAKKEDGAFLWHTEISHSKHIEIIFHFKGQYLLLNVNICFCTPNVREKVAVSYLSFKGKRLRST